ncbi:MAG: hypothetical protein AB1486_24210 [Planctomycetota bacterium]
MKALTMGCALTVLLGLLGGLAAAQSLEELIRAQRGGEMVLPDGVVASDDGTPAQGGAPGASQRAARLKQLEFDRRPSAILKAWSSNAPEKPKPPGEAEKESADSKGGLKDVLQRLATGEPLPAPAEKKTPESAPLTPEQLAAKKQAEQKQYESQLLEHELKLFQRSVTLGNWTDVKTYLAGLAKADAKTAYEQMLRSLQTGPKDRQRNEQMAQFGEKNVFTPQDVIGLASAAPVAFPTDIPKTTFQTLGAILRQCLDAGNVLEHVVKLMKEGLETEGFPLIRRQVALLFFGANEPLAAGEFLPPMHWAVEKCDREALNLLARHYVALHAKEKKTAHLEQAWTATLAALAAGEIAEEIKQEALTRAVDIAPKLREELGQAWLDESFTQRPERGMEILATIGAAVAQGMVLHMMEPAYRLKGLELQTTAANALLAASPELAETWGDTLNLLASNWLREALHTYQFDQSKSRGPSLQRDPYGNYFYYEYEEYYAQQPGRGFPQPIATAKMLDIRPSDAWLALAGEGLQPKFAMVFAQLLLKVEEEAEAFPYIENLASTHPDQAKSLVDEFLRVWARNHNPNQSRNRTNPYMYVYGYETKAAGIPLTRSKQDRNLRELAEWVGRLRKLPLAEIDEGLLADAFVTAHSTAEVYRLETIEQVFGPMTELEPKTLAKLAQRMRSNLVSVWRQPATQKDAKTNRRPKDIQTEVVRGYEVARAVIEEGLAKHAGEWSLLVAEAALDHDENNYHQEIEKSPEFTARRCAALEAFGAAAERYAAGAAERVVDEETTEAYDTWFYAALGACDLGAIDQEKQLVTDQVEKIRSALLSLPGEAAERHLAMFANNLFVRMSSVNPAVKFRYLRAGLEIVGDHEMAREARSVFNYYNDLVTEIELVTRVDGSDVVGHGEPFGLIVNIRHTREIERESGGFAKYLVNQNTQRYAYNYGRPLEDYRDKFEEAAREALSEHFEVLSVTFNHPGVTSIAEEEYGWRYTPYAYLLLRAKGPEVDRVPPLRIDMDFIDTSGYTIIPIESSPLVIDASPETGEPRPFTNLHLTQTLDERQAAKGRLILEVKATAQGLIPDLDTIVELAPAEFAVTNVEDQGVAVSEFDEESEEPAVLTKRTWMITMEGREGLAKLPETFSFGSPRVAGAEAEFMRYVDADLEKVEATLSLEHQYGETGSSWWWILPVGLVVLAVAGFFVARAMRGTVTVTRGRFQIPGTITPFTAIGVLRDIQHNNGILDRQELESEIERIERYYFFESDGEPPDLERIVHAWVQRAG